MTRRAEQVNDQVWWQSSDRTAAVEVQVNDRLDDQVGRLVWDLVYGRIERQVQWIACARVWRRVWDQAVEDTDGSNSRA